MKNIYLSLILLFSFMSLHAQDVIYVNHAATGNNTGADWDNAFTDLNVALNNSSSNDHIWVAQGVYKPGNIPSASFTIDHDLVLLGGFEGNETSADERDPSQYETILSGDVLGNDILDDFESNRGDNAWTVINIESGVSPATQIDGFTISHGDADGPALISSNIKGGGIYCSGSPIIRQCVLTQNYALDSGGGLYYFGNPNKTITLENCHFNNNKAGESSAAHLFNCWFEIDGCTFQNNTHDPDGGATLYILDPQGGTISNSVIEGNQADIAAGIVIWRRVDFDPGNVMVEVLDCIFNDNSSNFDPGNSTSNSAGMILSIGGDNTHFVVKGCEFTNNYSGASGAAMNIIANGPSNDSGILVDSCRFSMNEAMRGGGAIHTELFGDNFTLELTNSEFLNNHSIALISTGSVSLWGVNQGTGTATVDNCNFEGNSGGEGGAMWVGNTGNNGASMDFFIKNSSFISNEVTGNGGAIALASGENSQTDVTIEDCEFSGNSGDGRGGAIRCFTGLGPSLYHFNRCSFTDNESPTGGALYIRNRAVGIGEVIMENSLVATNSSSAGAIFADTVSNVTLRNCSVVNNESNGLEIANESNLSLQNTILYNPGQADFLDITSDNAVQSAGGNMVNDNSMSGLLSGPGDLENTSPDFDSEFKPITDGNLVNAGVNDGVTSPYDLAMNPRIQQGIVDIGAYENINTSVKEILAGPVKVSPNPASAFLNLETPEELSGSIEVSLFDAQGKLIKRIPYSNEQPVWIGELASGLYTLKLNNKKRVYTTKFIKE